MQPTASFPEVAEHVYFRGHAVVDSLLHALNQFHVPGAHAQEDGHAVIDYLTHNLHPNHEQRDMRNAVSILLADLIAESRDAGGRISAQAMMERWGPFSGKLLDRVFSIQLPDPQRDRPDNPMTRNEFIRHVSIFAPHRIGELVRSIDLPDSLPAIDFCAKLMGDVDPSICAIVCVQHLFGSTVPLIRALARRVSPDAVFVLGKPYSTNHAVVWKLREYGYYVHPGSYRYRGRQEYHLESDEHIASLLLACLRAVGGELKTDGRRVLVLDDGGRAIRMLHTPAFAGVEQQFTCVEQTRRGVRELESWALKLPVVNVAESPAKLIHESPIIAASVKLELECTLSRLRAAGIDIGDRAFVIGFGAIGHAVATAMRDGGWQVGVWDVAATRRADARSQGWRVEETLANALPEYHVIVGCSGEVSVAPAEYGKLRDGAVLVSASSSDVEFRSWVLRSHAASFSTGYRHVDDFNLVYERFQNRLLYLGDVDHPCHFLYVVRIAGKHVFLINGGFPVNMTGEVDPIPANIIQLTRALLFAGAVQASRERRGGLIPLDPEWQQALIGQYRELIREDAGPWPKIMARADRGCV